VCAQPEDDCKVETETFKILIMDLCTCIPTADQLWADYETEERDEEDRYDLDWYVLAAYYSSSLEEELDHYYECIENVKAY